MRTIIFLILLTLFGSGNISAQGKIHTVVQQKAEPKEGMAQFYAEFMRKFNIPELPDDVNEINLRIRFVVEKNGTFSSIQSMGVEQEELGEEAVRVLKTMPAWNPARHKGKKVRSHFTLPIKVRLHSEPQPSLMTGAELKSYIDSLDVSLIETRYFEMKCNCVLIKSSIKEDDTTEEFMLESDDEEAYYNIVFTKIDETESEIALETIKNDARSQNALLRDIYFQGSNAVEITFSMTDDGFTSHYRMIFFYKNGYLIGTNIAAHNPQVADVLIEHLKQTFKLKI